MAGRWPSASEPAPVADGENFTGHLAGSEDIHRQLAKVPKILTLSAMEIWTCLLDSIVNYGDTETYQSFMHWGSTGRGYIITYRMD